MQTSVIDNRVAVKLRTTADIAMSTCVQQTTISVSAPWLNQPVALTDLQEVEGKMFVKVTKGCNRIARILTGTSIGKARKLSSTDILETMQRLRNQKQAAICKERAEQQTEKAAEDLGMDAAPDPKRLKTLASVLPPTVSIMAPALQGHECLQMTVLTASENTPIFLEVNSENIDYLHAAFMEQEEKPPAHDHDARGRPRGVHWCRTKQSFRVSYTEDGKTRQKYFKPDSCEEACMEAAVEKAKDWLSTFSQA